MRSLQVFVSRHELTGLLKNVSDEGLSVFFPSHYDICNHYWPTMLSLDLPCHNFDM